MDDGGTQQINMVGFTTKGMGYIQYRGWHHSWDGSRPGPVATRSYHNHAVNERYDYGADAAPTTVMRRHQAHRRARGREQRRIAGLKSRLGKDDGEIASLKNEVGVRVQPAARCFRACVCVCAHTLSKSAHHAVRVHAL